MQTFFPRDQHPGTGVTAHLTWSMTQCDWDPSLSQDKKRDFGGTKVSSKCRSPANSDIFRDGNATLGDAYFLTSKGGQDSN